MKKKLSKILGVGLAVVLAISLGAVAAPPQDSEVAASPDVTFRLSAASTAGTACWVPKATFTPYAGDWSVQLDHDAPAGSVYLEFVPEPGITLSDLAALTNEWSFWYHLDTSSWGPYLELKFTSCGGDFIDITIMRQTSDLIYNNWTKVVLTTSIGGVQYWGNVRGSVVTYAGSTTLQAALIALEAVSADWSAADWELTRVQVQLWEAVDRTCYVDDIKIDGTLHAVERGPEFWIDPDIAYNVKTALETFTAMGPCGPLPNDGTAPVGDPYVVSWTVEKGCGEGDVTTIFGGAPASGGNAGDNYITISMVTKGDAHVCALIDPDGTEGGDGEAELIRVCAEKKWGEIYCTELTRGTMVDDEVCVTEYVEASFLWYDCLGELELPADGAVVDWWLMGIGALAAVQALEAALGDDPCDVDGGCGDYELDFFSYDVDGDGTIQADEVFDSPRDAMLAIYAFHELTTTQKNTNYIMPDVTLPADKTHTTTTSGTDGKTTVTVHTEAVTSVILATLTDYPTDKHGQNTVCVQHETFVAPPPPAQVKTTQVRWAGEKIVLEKNWTGYVGKLVMFALEEGSIGDLIPVDTFSIVSSDSRTVFTRVNTDGVARVMFKTEQQGQVDVECVLYSGDFVVDASFDEVAQVYTEGMDVIENTGFVVYYLFLEEVTPWEPQPAAVDPAVPAAFAVDVKGCFWTTSLPGTTREARIITFEVDGGGTVEYELPYGRYVLPDDWPLMAGPNWRMLRPWMDLMAEPGAVSSLYELGPYVVVNSPSGVAALPCIGPFSSLQQWSTLNMWITNAMVPADDAIDMDPFTAGLQSWDLRNTVIPDNWLSPFDCPMPPAEIHFVITASVPVIGPSLSEAFKDTGPTYDWPFYASEIPANRLIPPMKGTVEGYWWDSWEFGVWTPDNALQGEGPYWFHWDLGQTPSNRVLEAYSDNLGTCAVYINALGGPGSVTIKAFADYPYLPAKFPPVESDEVTQVWGAIELNPHFVADKSVPQEVDVGETVTFTNLTTGGTLPYTDADWNWGDGTTHGITAVNNGETITHEYNTPGLYSVILTMTDSTPTTRWEERPDYILVAGEVGLPGDANGDGVVNALDITYLEMIIAGLEDETPGADANQDGVVNALDITYLEMIIAGLV